MSNWLRRKRQRVSAWLWGYDYFISYHWQSGGKYAVALSQLLQERKFDCFLDKAEFVPGDDWKEEAALALRSTQRLIVIATQEALTESEPVAHEVSLFANRGRHIIPIHFGSALPDEGDSPLLTRFKESIVRLVDSHEALGTGKPNVKEVVDKLLQTDRVLRRRKLRRSIMGGAVVVLLTLATATSIAAYVADRLRGLAVAESLAQRSLRLIENEQDVELAGLLSCCGYRLNRDHRGSSRISPIDEALRAYLAQEIHHLRWPARDVHAMDSSADGRLVAAGNRDGSVLVWDRTQTAPDPLLLRHGERPVQSVAFDPKGRFLASAGADGIRLWKLPAYDRSEPLPHHPQTVYALAFSPSGRHLVSGGRDGTVRFWDVESSRAAPAQYPQDEIVRHLAFSGDGRVLAVGSRTLNVYAVGEKETELDLIRQIQGSVRNGLALDGSGARLAKSGGRWVLVYDLESDEDTPMRLEHPSLQTFGLAFRDTDGLLATGGMGGEIYLWELQAPEAPVEKLLGHSFSVRSLRFSPDGASLLSGSRDGTVRIWSPAAHSEPKLVGEPELPVYSVAYSPVGTELVFGDGRGGVWLWTGSDQDPPRKMEGPSGRGPVHALAFSPDGKKVVRVLSGIVTLIDLAGRNVEEIRLRTANLRGAAFSTDGTVLAVSGSSGVFLYPAGIGSEPVRLRSSRPRALAFDPTDAHLAAATAEGVVVWRESGGSWVEAARLVAGDAWYSVAFDPGGERIIGGSQDGDVAIWPLDSPSGEPTRFRAHRGAVESMSVNPSDRTLATFGADRVVRIWNLDDPSQTPLILRTNLPEVQVGSVTVSFRADGAKLAAAGGGRVHVWSSRTDEVAELVCSGLRIGPLDDETWANLVGADVPRYAFGNDSGRAN